MENLWKINSGKCAGYKSGNRLYNLDGKNIGHFRGAIAYLLNGQFIGELYKEKYIGKRDIKYPDGFAYSAYETLDVEDFDSTEGLVMNDWKDPDF